MRACCLVSTESLLLHFVLYQPGSAKANTMVSERIETVAGQVCTPLGDGCDGCYLISRAPRRWDQREGWHAEILPGVVRWEPMGMGIGLQLQRWHWSPMPETF